MLPEDFIREIRDSIKLSGVISRKVKLVKKGKNFLGLCPFHNEKTPSFNVNDDLSVSYGELTDTRSEHSATAALDTDMKSMQVAYSMGSMSIKAKRVETDNPYHTSSKTEENSEISLSFSF